MFLCTITPSKHARTIGWSIHIRLDLYAPIGVARVGISMRRPANHHLHGGDASPGVRDQDCPFGILSLAIVEPEAETGRILQEIAKRHIGRTRDRKSVV